MNQILQPVFVLVALTFVVVLRLGMVRIGALRRRQLHPAYFKALTGAEPAPEVLSPARNLANLFEFPVLFYVAAGIIWAGRLTDGHYLGLAWVFVGLRLAHTTIHLTTNNVRARFGAFLLSLVPLAAIWIRLALRLW